MAESVYMSWRAAMMPGVSGFSRAVRTLVRSADLDPGGRGHSSCLLTCIALHSSPHHLATFSAFVACSERIRV